MTDGNDQIEHLRSKLGQGGIHSQNAAAELAKRGHYDRDVIVTLCGMLLDKAGNVEATAQELLSGVSLVEAIYPLLGGVPSEARFAAQVLFRRNEWANEDPATLMSALRFLDFEQFEDLVGHLRKSPPSADAFEDLLLQLEQNPSGSAWEQSPPDILAAFGPTIPEEVVSRIANLLRSDSDSVRSAAVKCLGAAGSRARCVAPAVHAALWDTEIVCWEVPMALARILVADAVPWLVEVLVDPCFHCAGHELTRVYAADALRALGPLAADAVHSLNAALSDPDAAVRDAARAALAAITPQSGPEGH